MTKKLTAEFLGTAWLVLGGCGTAMLAGGGVGLVGISIAFGLTVLTIAYSLGSISGAHLNPAVSIGLWMGGRFDSKELVPYIGSQILGAVFGAGILYLIVTGNDSEIGDFAANGYGDHSPKDYSLMACLITEVVMTFFFMMVILGSTSDKAPKGFAGIVNRIEFDTCSLN